MNKEIRQNSTIYYQNNLLHFAGHDLSKKISHLKTPFYLYSLNQVNNNYIEFQSLAKNYFSKYSIHYALKANSQERILKKLNSLGCGADIVSIGEFKKAVEAGIPLSKIIFSGVGKTEEEIEYILKNFNEPIKAFNVESLDELESINAISKKYQKITPISFRLNPGVHAKTHQHISTGGLGHKFGLSKEQIEIAVLEKTPNIKIVGLSIHIGSQLKDFSATHQAILEIIGLIKNTQLKLEFVDVGGGLGIYYGPNDHNITLPEEYFKLVKNSLMTFFNDETLPEIVFEPGRFISGNTGVIITKVIRLKNNGHKNFVILDSAMNDLIRPALYHAYHEILPLTSHQEQNELYDFVGPICETGDFFAIDRLSSPIKKGDLLAIGNCGSYARSMASTYNAREIAPEYFIEEI